MKKKESLEGLDDTVTLNQLKKIFGSGYCSMLTCKPKLFLLNGWKESAKDSMHDGMGTGPSEEFSTINSDFLTICSSFNNISSLSAGPNLPASIFPCTLCDIVLMYKDETVISVMSTVNSELIKKSKKIIKLNGKAVDLNESCMSETTLRSQLQLFAKKLVLLY